MTPAGMWSIINLDSDAMVEHAREHFVMLNHREPDAPDLIRTLGYLCAFLAQHVPAGYIQWPPARKVAPPRQQRPQITDDAPETPSE